MKKLFTRIILLLVVMLFSKSLLQAQLLITQDFNFSGALSANGWTGHSGVGTNPITTTTGLTYTGLLGTAVGNAALVKNLGGQDDNITFTNQTTDGQNIYYSCLVNITDAATDKAGDYFLHIGDVGGATFTLFAARVFAKITASAVNFGISNTSTATYGVTSFAKNTTYLLIVKYTINVAGNDPVSLWVIPAGVPATEAAAGTPEATNTITAGQNAIAAVALRQGSAVNSPETAVDAIKVGLTWANVTPGSVIPPSLTVTGSLTDFGNVFIGSNSGSQTYNLSGANLTGAPGTVTVTAPSSDFQVSNNNTIWGASTTIAYASATLSATPVYVRFSPQSAGLKTGNVSNIGAGVTVAINVAASGTGVIPPTPIMGAGSLTSFGNVCINTFAGPNSFTINGSNLTATNITVGPLAGFTFSATAAGSYLNSLNLTQPGGVFAQQIFVLFTPAAAQSYDGNIAIAGGGAATINVAAVGAGNNNAPSVITGTAGGISITAATLAGNISSVGCSAVAGYGVEYSLINGFVNGTAVTSFNLTGGAFSANLSGLSPATTYYYKAYSTNAGGTAYGAQQSFVTSTPVLTATPLTAFGALCINIVSAANSFTISSAGLNAANVTVAALAGYSFSTTAAGTYTNTLSLTQPGGAYSQIVFVKFSPVTLQSYNANILVSGGGANAIAVAVSGIGVNAPATVSTGAASAVTANAATLAATISVIGCSNVTAYGIEYSSISGFANGQGTKVVAGNLIATNFTASINGLVQNSTYYFKGYAVNNGGIAYGAQALFTTAAIPDGLMIYGNPIARGGNLHYSIKNIKPSHYAAKIYNSNGQLIYRRDMIVQVNFIDDHFIVPSNIGSGLYSLEIESVDFSTRKSFMIR